jgi:geranylgeranyl diphosphate synthase type II
LSRFLDMLAKKANLIDEALHSYLPPASEAPPVIHEAMRYSVFAGGKRLRPALTLAAAQAVHAPERLVLPAACAVELIHTYSLIHDDLPAMDNDDLRRGKPTSHRVFGEAVALLAGSALFALAFEVLAGCRRDGAIAPDRTLTVLEELSAACGTAGLIGGQVLDVTSVFRTVGEAELEALHRAKTGALFRMAVRSGAILGGAGPGRLERLTAFAEHFGLAFQITDDILDVTGQAEQTGKPAGSDVRNKKHTYVSVCGLETARQRGAQNSAAALAALGEFGPEADFLRQAAVFIVSREF